MLARDADKQQSTLLETQQGAVGFVIDRDYYEIQVPLEGAS